MKIIQAQARKGPLRYLERIKVDTVRLGKQQPVLSSCTVSTDAAAGSVQFALPFSFTPAEGFSIVVTAPSTLDCHRGCPGCCCSCNVMWDISARSLLWRASDIAQA